MPRTKGRNIVCSEPSCGIRFRAFRGNVYCKCCQKSCSHNMLMPKLPVPASTVESWFESDSISISTVVKKNLPVIFTVPDHDGTLRTLEAQQDFNGRIGHPDDFHVLVRSSLTPAYPVPMASFLDKYIISEITVDAARSFLMDCATNSDYEAVPKTLPVKVIRAPVSGSLSTAWGSILPFSQESFILRYNQEDFAVIAPDVFESTYQAM